MAGIVVNARGLVCPLPVLRLRKALLGLAGPGQVVLEATDGAALVDVPAFCLETGHQLVGCESRDGVHRFTVRKNAAGS